MADGIEKILGRHELRKVGILQRLAEAIFNTVYANTLAAKDIGHNTHFSHTLFFALKYLYLLLSSFVFFQ
jgi:hypothetical protein